MHDVVANVDDDGSGKPVEVNNGNYKISRVLSYSNINH